MPAAVVKDGTVTPKFRQGKISAPFLTAKFSPRNSPLAKFPPPLYRWREGGRVLEWVGESLRIDPPTAPPPPPPPPPGWDML